MRLGGQEPTGVVTAPGTTVTMHSDKAGSWQTLNSHGTTTTYHVDYVIGSGTHASGYLMDLGNHLFQSPVAYYLNRSAYGLAPGYEDKSDPDFTRPIATGCVFCHAGSFDAVEGSQNRYAEVPFPHLAISCNRCHGSLAAHLAKPESGNIVNPAYLDQAARDSVCEQCHLIGVARILNPGKKFTDFVAGKPLEETFTIYHNESPKGTEATFKVISHSEQLALSKCARNSGGRMWCGACHNPHNEPTDPVSYYRGRCMLCHSKTTFASDHPDKTSNCIGCHMTKREAGDGGHSAFTDHRIQQRPQKTVAEESPETIPDIVPWRQPPTEFATRNLGMALTEYGLSRRSAKQILSGYRTLTTVQQQFSQDSELYNMLGTALIAGQQYGEAVQAFAFAARYDSDLFTQGGQPRSGLPRCRPAGSRRATPRESHGIRSSEPERRRSSHRRVRQEWGILKVRRTVPEDLEACAAEDGRPDEAKIKFKKLAYFSAANNDRQRTIICRAFTTN